MTKERAIKVINVFLGNNDLCSCSDENGLHVSCKECRREAAQMAIEALEENESLSKSLNDAAELIRKLQKNNPG